MYALIFFLFLALFVLCLLTCRYIVGSTASSMDYLWELHPRRLSEAGLSRHSGIQNLSHPHESTHNHSPFVSLVFFFHFSHVRPPSTAFVPHKSNSIFYSPYVQITAPSWPRIRIVLLSVREFGWAAASPALSLTSAKPNSHPAIGPESSSINRSVRKGLFRITFRQIDFWKYFLFKGVTMKVMIFLKIGSYQKRYESKLKEFQYRRSK